MAKLVQEGERGYRAQTISMLVYAIWCTRAALQRSVSRCEAGGGAVALQLRTPRHIKDRKLYREFVMVVNITEMDVKHILHKLNIHTACLSDTLASPYCPPPLALARTVHTPAASAAATIAAATCPEPRGQKLECSMSIGAGSPFPSPPPLPAFLPALALVNSSSSSSSSAFDSVS